MVNPILVGCNRYAFAELQVVCLKIDSRLINFMSVFAVLLDYVETQTLGVSEWIIAFSYGNVNRSSNRFILIPNGFGFLFLVFYIN